MINSSEKPARAAGKWLAITAAVTVIGVSLTAHAGIYTFTSGSLNQSIPDNNPSGVAYGVDFAAAGLHVTDIKVSFTTSGGWNGDLYAYLSHGSDYAVLLNRVGATTSTADGYSTSGLNILLEPVTTHPGLTDIHTVQAPSAPPTAYAADGRTVFYDDASRTQTLDVFVSGGGVDPYGSWTLFFADRAAVSTATLTGWTLEITAVPEPVNLALGCFAGLFLVGSFIWNLRMRRLSCSHD